MLLENFGVKKEGTSSSKNKVEPETVIADKIEDEMNKNEVC